MEKQSCGVTLVDQRNIDRAVERYESALAGLLRHAPLNQAAELMTSTLDNALCDAWGNAQATRYWRRHLEQRCGSEALRGVGARFEVERMPTLPVAE